MASKNNNEAASPAPENGAATTAVSGVISTNGSVATVSASATVLTPAYEVDENKGLVKVKIGYPKDFKAQKYFADGDEIFVAQETAEQFIKTGIAKKV